jgi:hypothetical protein
VVENGEVEVPFIGSGEEGSQPIEGARRWPGSAL